MLGKRNAFVMAAVIAALMVVVCLLCYINRSGQIPIGEYVAEQGRERMTVDADNVRIIRGKSTLYLLPNMTNRRVYSKDDLSKAKPQRLNLAETNVVQWVREAAGPTPQYKVMFVRKGGGK